MRLRVVRALALLLLAAALAAAAGAQTESVLWAIGREDGSDREFALSPGSWNAYGLDGFFVVGRSQAERDWPYVQPGPIDSWAGSRPHTAEVAFALAEAPAGATCRLELALLDAQYGTPPHLLVELNGKSQTLQTSRGFSDAFLSGGAGPHHAAKLVTRFPAGTLCKGLNTLRITTVAGSWLIYDSLTMTSAAGASVGPVGDLLHLQSADWLPDVLTRKAGRLQQLLKLEVVNFGPAKDVELQVSGEPTRRVKVATGRTSLTEAYPESSRTIRTAVRLSTTAGSSEPPLVAERRPCRHYTIYCIEHSHMDVGYNYLQAEALTRHGQYLVEGLKQIAATAALPSDDRFRWNVESLIEVEEWLKRATPTQIAEFQQAAKRGDLGLAALYCNELTGLCRPEELVSLLASADRIRRRYGVPIDTAMISDVPGVTWGIVTVMAQSGVKYFSWGPNPSDHLGSARDFDQQPFYWLSPSGKERILVWQGINGYQPSFGANDASLIQFVRDFGRRFPSSPYEMLYDRRTTGDNAAADFELTSFLHSWNSRYAYPHLVMSTTSRAFHDFEARYGRKLPTLRGDYTGYWEDGAASSAVETALNRGAAETLSQDEILWTMLDPAHFPHARMEAAWKNAVLYDEHTWGADRSWSEPESDFTRRQWAVKRQFAVDAAAEAVALREEALHAVTLESSSAIAVFNTCSWPRTDLVVLPAGQSRAGDLVRTADGKPVPSQRLADGTLAFLAADVQAIGARRFTIAAGAAAPGGRASAAPNGLATGRMSLALEPGSGTITSWRVAGIAENLVREGDPTCRGLNEYLYVLGDDNRRIQRPTDCRITVVDAGPLVATVRVDSAAPGAAALTRLVTVIDGLDEVRIEDTVDKTAVHTDEAVHFGFPLNVRGGAVRMEMPWSVVRPGLDQTPHANKNVCPVDRWADISNAAYGVTCCTLDTPLLQTGEVTLPRENAGGWLAAPDTRPTLLWNAMNNYWHTNYKAYQPGQATFRYALKAHVGSDQAAMQRFGIGRSQPLITTPVRPDSPSLRLPLTLSNPAVQLSACRPATDGRGWLVRLVNGSDRPARVTLAWSGAPGARFTRTDLWGGASRPVAHTLTLAPQEVVTLNIEPR